MFITVNQVKHRRQQSHGNNNQNLHNDNIPNQQSRCTTCHPEADTYSPRVNAREKNNKQNISY